MDGHDGAEADDGDHDLLQMPVWVRPVRRGGGQRVAHGPALVWVVGGLESRHAAGGRFSYEALSCCVQRRIE